MGLTRLQHRLSDIKWWFLWRLHPKHRYHVVNTKLGPGYHDPDKLILHACFKLLEEYVEECGGKDGIESSIKELKGESFSTTNALLDAYNHEIHIRSEALRLYQWWTEEYPKEVEYSNELLRESTNDYCVLKQKIMDDEQKMLFRLIEIRQGLWI